MDRHAHTFSMLTMIPWSVCINLFKLGSWLSSLSQFWCINYRDVCKFWERERRKKKKDGEKKGGFFFFFCSGGWDGLGLVLGCAFISTPKSLLHQNLTQKADAFVYFKNSSLFFILFSFAHNFWTHFSKLIVLDFGPYYYYYILEFNLLCLENIMVQVS